MTYQATVLRVMIASPGDVPTERRAAREVVTEWNYANSEERGIVLMPVGWDTHSSPAMGGRPQSIINEQVLEKCDLLVAIFRSRIGSSTGTAVSGTVEEIKEHIGVGRPAMLYFCTAPTPRGRANKTQLRRLQQFKRNCTKRGLVGTYGSVKEFRSKFSRHLSLTVSSSYPTYPAKRRRK
jgi:hypothetical protein